MILRELMFYYRSHKAENIVLIYQVAMFFVLVGTFFSFTSEAHYKKSSVETIYQGKAIYQMLDGYQDPEEFEAFRNEPNSLNILKNYYNALNEASSFQYLAMFNQKIFIEDENSKFPNSPTVFEDKSVKGIDAFQLNAQACEYFRLKVSEGRFFDQRDFEDNGNILPVLMGSHYKDRFAVGDKMSGYHYQKEFIFEIVGFLEDNSLVYFNGNSEFYLDNYIVFPYVNFKEPHTELDDWFQKIVYFAMINGYISIPDGDAYSQNMLMELEAISEKTGFFNYVFIGSNPNIQQYRGLINILNNNFNMILTLLMLTFLVMMITIGFQTFMMQKNRLPIMAVQYVNGATMGVLIKQCVLEIALVIGLAAFLGWIVLLRLKIADPLVFLIFLITIFLYTIGISAFSIRKLNNIELMQILNQEDIS